MTKPVTDLIHHPYVPPAGFSAPQPAVHKASTVLFRDVAAMRARDWRTKAGYTYGLHGTPTTFMLEERIATLEDGKHCVLFPSGLAAIANVGMALLSAGDEVLIPSNAYGPNKALAEGEFTRWGITHQVYDAMDAADLDRRIGPKTKLVWLEAPGSVTMEFPPVDEQARICRQRGVVSVIFDERHSTQQVDRFCDALKLFKLGYSWGGPVSLVVPYEMAQLRLPQHWPHKGVLVRFSIGLEDVEDLRADLERALRTLQA